MIFVLEMPPATTPRAWFAFDVFDMQRKAGVTAPVEAGPGAALAGAALEQAEQALRERGDYRIYWDEFEATEAFEQTADPAWQGAGWRARWALREQLVALDVLADDL